MATPIQYIRAKSLAEALKLQSSERTAVLAGGALTLAGQDIPFDTWVDLQDIPEMRGIGKEGYIGAGAMLSRVAAYDKLPPALHESLTRAISPNILNNTSLGESLQRRAHPLLREWITTLVAYDPAIQIADPDGRFHVGNLQSLIESDMLDKGIVTRVHFPEMKPTHALSLAQVARTPSDAAIVCAAAFVYFTHDGYVEQAIGVLGGVNASPVVMSGLPIELERLTPETVATAVNDFVDQLQPISDYKGSAEYRREMARVCLTRALMQSVE